MLEGAVISIADPGLSSALGRDLMALDPRPACDPTKIEKVIASVFYGRSGTTLMERLIDNHPNVLSLAGCEFRGFFAFFETLKEKPAERQLLEFLMLYGRDVDDPEATDHRMIAFPDGKVRHVPRQVRFSSVSQEADFPPPLTGLVRSFLSHVVHLRGDPQVVSLTSREFFLIFNAAYLTALGQPPGMEARAVFWNCHVPDSETIESAASQFSEVQVIHSIRRPTQTLGSHFKRYYAPQSEQAVPGEISPERAAIHVVNMLLNHDRKLSGRANVEEFGVRLEDLHIHPERTTQRLAQRLGIEWGSTMMEATRYGAPFVYQARDRVIRTFDPGNLQNQHLDVFDGRDLIFLENLLFENYAKWNYSFLTQTFADDVRENALKMLALNPMKMEQLCWEKARAEGIEEEKIDFASEQMRAILYRRIDQTSELFGLL